MTFYREAREQDGFEAGIRIGLELDPGQPGVPLPNRRRPAGRAAEHAYPVADLQLASRLSFFLWSSIPDDELLDAAIRGELSKPEVLAKQTRRMLADPRARSLASNFADQWLYLRNLDSLTPDVAIVPRFRRQPASGIPARNGTVFREHLARGPEHP